MYIKTTYDQDFDDLYMHLKSKYPQKLFDADGIGKQTDMSAFSKNFFASSVTADASIDANANVDDVSVIAYETEINKPHLKLNSYYILWKELKRLYGLETANDIIEHQLVGDIYVHDAHGIGSGKPYSYYGGCCIIVKIDEVIKLLTFEEFFNCMAEISPVIDAGNDTFEIKTPNVLILDEGNVWTPVYKVLKHKSHTDMVRIATSCGKDTLVTTDHPVITTTKVRPAGDVSTSDFLKGWELTYDFIEESQDKTKLELYKKDLNNLNNKFNDYIGKLNTSIDIDLLKTTFTDISTLIIRMCIKMLAKYFIGVDIVFNELLNKAEFINKLGILN